MATPRKHSKLSLKKNVQPSASTSFVAPAPPPPPQSNNSVMRNLLLKKCDKVPKKLESDQYSVITIMSEDESLQAKLRTPEHIGENHALEELLQQLEGNAQHLYEPDRIIATPHMSELQRSPPPPPLTRPPTPPQQHLTVERYRHGGKNMQEMADLYAADGTTFARGAPCPRTPQELAERSYTWLQHMLPEYQAQLEATRSNIGRLQTELEASRTQELKLLDDMGRIQDYLNFLKQQEKW